MHTSISSSLTISVKRLYQSQKEQCCQRIHNKKGVAPCCRVSSSLLLLLVWNIEQKIKKRLNYQLQGCFLKPAI